METRMYAFVLANWGHKTKWWNGQVVEDDEGFHVYHCLSERDRPDLARGMVAAASMADALVIAKRMREDAIKKLRPDDGDPTLVDEVVEPSGNMDRLDSLMCERFSWWERGTLATGEEPPPRPFLFLEKQPWQLLGLIVTALFASWFTRFVLDTLFK